MLLSHNDFLWITRVPETLKQVKAWIEKPDSQMTWSLQDSGYKISSFSSHYGDIAQRWILVYSQQAFVREKSTFQRNLAKKSEALQKALWHLSHQIFGCQADIDKVLKKMRKQYPLHQITAQIEAIMKHPSKGRPTRISSHNHFQAP